MKIIAKTLFGLEKVAAEELTGLGAIDVTVANRAVIFTGEMPLLYSANYMSRCCLSFLMEVGAFRIRSAEDLYKGILRIGWDNFMSPDNTFSVVPVINSELFNHTGFAALKAKDAIADYFRNKTGRRPSVKTSDPDLLINLHISHNDVTVSLDSSGVPLYRRGYRKETVAAPLNEVLAAGMIKLSGWKEDEPLTDPMCGSGTIPIEAALMACRIPPGRMRTKYGFQGWKDHDPRLFDAIKEKWDKQTDMNRVVKIRCSDLSPDAIRQAEGNISNAGLAELLNPSVSDFRDLRPEPEAGMIIMNPPYGERISQGDTNELYGMIGSTLKHTFEGYTAWIISSNRESLKFIGLKPSSKQVLFNGALECYFQRFDLYRGSRKNQRN